LSFHLEFISQLNIILFRFLAKCIILAETKPNKNGKNLAEHHDTYTLLKIVIIINPKCRRDFALYLSYILRVYSDTNTTTEKEYSKN
jgi:hypothetical protein